MLGAGHLSLSTAGGGGNSKSLSFVIAYEINYTSNGNTLVPILGQVGDLIVLFVSSSVVAGTMTGWNLLYNDTVNVSGNPTYRRAYWKIKTSGDTSFSDTWPNYYQIVYRPSSPILSVSITNLLRASYTTTTPVAQTLTMPSDGIYIGMAKFDAHQSYWLTKTSSVTPTRHPGNSAYSSVMLFENLTGNQPFASSTIGGTTSTSPIVSRTVMTVNVTL